MTRTSWTAVLLALASAGSLTAAPQSNSDPFETTAEPVARSPIDKLVFGQLKKRGIRPARPCSDAVFLRRVYLDTLGTLPTVSQARAFLTDRHPDKRRTLIDRLLQRGEFADYWAMKWCDLLRVKAEFPINLWPNAAQAYHRWVRTCLATNVPYDRFAHAVLTASGSNFRVPQVNFYRAMQGRDPRTIARTVALTFMGVRAEKWSKGRLAGMAGFFSQVGYKPTAEWKEEIVFFDTQLPQRAAVYPDGTQVRLLPGQDPREVFADWLVAPRNPFFAKSVVNRIWAWLLGRGIVHEPDDIRPDNPPSNPELLAWLEKELVRGGYDLKNIYRQILESQTYQLSCVPRSRKPGRESLFACYPLRRLEAEVLIDALNQITGTTDRYSSAIPEPFTFIPPSHRSITLPDGSITSSFLEMFGRPARDTGLWAERSDLMSSAQRLHLLNSSHVQRKLEQGNGLRFLRQARGRPRELAVRLYLTILSRFPTDAELQEVLGEVRGGRQRNTWTDVAWALVNSAEFLYRH